MTNYTSANLQIVKDPKLDAYVIIDQKTGKVLFDHIGEGYESYFAAKNVYCHNQPVEEPHWSQLNKAAVEILTQPIVPGNLHYVAPRRIMGKQKWDALKRQKRQSANHHCTVCQRYVPHRDGDWLYLHERYQYDFEKRIEHYVGCASVCYECHMYIHQGLLQLQSLAGDLSFDKMQAILTRGNQILERFGLQAIEPPESFEEDDWKLEFEGNFYRRLTEADLRPGNFIDPSRIKDGDIIQVSEND